MEEQTKKKILGLFIGWDLVEAPGGQARKERGAREKGSVRGELRGKIYISNLYMIHFISIFLWYETQCHKWLSATLSILFLVTGGYPFFIFFDYDFSICEK